MSDPAPLRRSRFDRAFYWFAWWVVFAVFRVLYRFRREGADNVPGTGAALLVSNHVSHFDPPIIGLGCVHRPYHPIARESLFRNRFFGWLIRTLGAIPLRDNQGDLGAIRVAIEALNRGEMVCVFPEGSRSRDGELQPFKRGVTVLLKRSACPVIPVAIDGAHDVWPRARKFPKLTGRIRIRFGAPIPHDDLLRDGEEKALDRIRDEIAGMLKDMRTR